MAFPHDLFDALAPEFIGVSDTAVEAIGVEAARFVNVSIWKAKADLGVVYMTAHMLKMAQLAGSNASGQVIREKVGDLERGYAAPNDASSSSELAQTKYGQEFVRVRGTLQISPFVVT